MERTRGFAASSPAVVGGVVYVRVWYGSTYALNALTGATLWNCTRVDSCSSPAVSNGFCYVCSSGYVNALDSSTGSLIWSYYIGSNGMVLLCSREYHLYKRLWIRLRFRFVNWDV